MDPTSIRKLLAVPDGSLEIPEGTWKRAAVLALFIPGSHGDEILFTRRTDNVMDHKGQVSFPGGAVEPEDRNLEATALREAREEIGLDPGAVELLGRSNDMFTVSGWWVTPIVGWLLIQDSFIPNPSEVSRVFTLPLDWLANPGNWEKRTFIKDDRMRSNVIFYQTYDNELLWGITAQLVHDLLKKIKLME